MNIKVITKNHLNTGLVFFSSLGISYVIGSYFIFDKMFQFPLFLICVVFLLKSIGFFVANRKVI